MGDIIGCDAHKKYSMFVTMGKTGEAGRAMRVGHERKVFRAYVNGLPLGSRIAVETVGNWYWMIDEMERAGHEPLLTHARKAKMMMGQVNKTDTLDARGLATLLKNGTLPSVWIPPRELRDQRELTRMRMALVGVRTMVKNRIHATLAKYAIVIDEVSDMFGVKGRELVKARSQELPPETRRSVEQQLIVLDQMEAQIAEAEQRIQEIIARTPMMQRLMTLPGVGPILGSVIALEMGSVERFASAERFASYCGTVPRVSASGGKTHYGRVRSDVNRSLKWAFVEAANLVVMQQKRLSGSHAVRLYQRLRVKKGHAKAAMAMARHLSEAAYWVVKKDEAYREPTQTPVSSTHG